MNRSRNNNGSLKFFSEPSQKYSRGKHIMNSGRPHSIHHVNFPTTNVERTKEWYAKVFGMHHVDVSHLSNTKVLLMSRGNFELHFTPIEEMRRMAPSTMPSRWRTG